MLFEIVSREDNHVIFSDGVVVTVNQIIGSDTKDYEAWEIGFEGHSTIGYFDHVRYGTIPTRRLPEELDALPAMTDERIKAVQEWHEEQYQTAYRYILAAYPEAEKGTPESGRIAVY